MMCAANASNANEGVLYPGSNDVMFGRGGETNYHVGNTKFRAMIAKRFKLRYQEAKTRAEKSRIAMEAIHHWREGQDPPGRFLARRETSQGGTGMWYEVSNDVVFKKAIKVLGENITKGRGQAEASKKHGHGPPVQEPHPTEASTSSMAPLPAPSQDTMVDEEPSMAVARYLGMELLQPHQSLGVSSFPAELEAAPVSASEASYPLRLETPSPQGQQHHDYTTQRHLMEAAIGRELETPSNQLLGESMPHPNLAAQFMGPGLPRLPPNDVQATRLPATYGTQQRMHQVGSTMPSAKTLTRVFDKDVISSASSDSDG